MSTAPQPTAGPPDEDAPPPHGDLAAEQPLKKAKADTQHASRKAREVKPIGMHAIPTSDALLTSRVRRELKAVWADAKSAATRTDGAAAAVAKRKVEAVVPPFKVGTLEMYRRFPEAYEVLMEHHNCDAVSRFLLHDVLDRIVASHVAPPADPSPPLLQVADFGCGTGRIEHIVTQHPAVRAVYAYDSETAMLVRCLHNTVRGAALAGHYDAVRLLPQAEAPADTASSPPGVELCGDSSASSSSGAVLRVCLRPVPFQAVQNGFLTATHHPRCSVVVCAWSLSYVMRLQWGEDNWHAAIDAVVQALIDALDNRHGDAAVVILETLGNGSTKPTRQNTYTQRLEEHFGFTRTWMRTDYEFATAADAERLVRFFFGGTMLKVITTDDVAVPGAAEGGACRLMECTGIWTYWKRREGAGGGAEAAV